MSIDRRVAELEALAREEGIALPMPARRIVELENEGKIVDLVTGEVYSDVTVQPTRHAKAVAYLLSDVVGEVSL